MAFSIDGVLMFSMDGMDADITTGAVCTLVPASHYLLTEWQ